MSPTRHAYLCEIALAKLSQKRVLSDLRVVQFRVTFILVLP